MPKVPNSDSQLSQEVLQEALTNGHRASEVLGDVLAEISELHCAEAYGFEGSGTFPECGKCIVCLAVELNSKTDN